MNFNFYRDGGSGSIELPVVGPYLPCVMKMIAKVQMVEFSPGCDLDLFVQRTQRFLDDTLPEVVNASIGEELYQKVRQLEGKSYMVGTGNYEPQGVFTSDRIRRTHSDLSADAVISLVCRIQAAYRTRSVFLCNDSTSRALRRLTDNDGRHIWKDSYAAGVPNRIMGFPAYTDPDAPDGKLMFGDFQEGYVIQSRPTIKIIRDPFSQKPSVMFWVHHKTNGFIDNDEALEMMEFDHE